MMGELTVLGKKVTGSLDASGLETFDAPEDVTMITFETDELAAMCPVTKQPDLYTMALSYIPNGQAIESKTLKLYLHSFRDQGIFGEHLASRIARDIFLVVGPYWVEVILRQGRRGGLDMTVTATLGEAE